MIKWITKDWGIKLISLILAIGLWYYAQGEESVEVKRVVPLTIKLKNEQMSIRKTSAKTVHVTLQAPRGLLTEMTSEDISVMHEIGAEAKSAGDYSFRIEPREVKIRNPQIRVIEIEPEVVQVTIDELIVQKVKIIPEFVGEPAIGYSVKTAEIQLDPNAILVEGPKGELEKIDALKTEPLDLVGRTRPFRRTVRLNIPSNLKALSESAVDAFIPISEQLDEKVFENIEIGILKPAQKNIRAELVPSLIALPLQASKAILDNIQAQNLQAYVDLNGLEYGEHELPVRVVLPEGVKLKKDQPLIVKVTLKKS